MEQSPPDIETCANTALKKTRILQASECGWTSPSLWACLRIGNRCRHGVDIRRICTFHM